MLFTFPSRYLFTIGRAGVLRVGGWSPQIPTGFHVPCGTQEHPRANSAFEYGPVTLSRAAFQLLPLASMVPRRGPTTPRGRIPLVCPIPLSLAATRGVSVDFLSSGYLDVSVRRVGLLTPMNSAWDGRSSRHGLPHSDISGSKVAQHLTGAFRSWPRPSSPLRAKASTISPSKLDHRRNLETRARRDTPDPEPDSPTMDDSRHQYAPVFLFTCSTSRFE